jgi:uncharacterized protein with PIN domain
MSDRPKFAADEMLGTLARWLRLMGYDMVYAKDMDDSELLSMAKNGGRFLLTRDRELSQRAGDTGLYVESDDLDKQLMQVAERFDLRPDPDRARCTVCNGELREVGKEAAIGNVPDGALEANSLFYVCTGCGKFYWRGSHWKNISRRLEDLTAELDSRGGSSPR